MTPCERFRVDLAAHLYGDLDRASAELLEGHLRECAGCREELRALQRTTLSLGDDVMFPREAEVDWESFAAATVQRARGFRAPAAPARGASRPSWLRPFRISPAWSAAAAGLLVLIGAAGSYAFLALRGGEAAPAPAVAELAPTPAAVVLPEPMLANLEAASSRSSARRFLAESRALLSSLLATPLHCGADGIDIHEERARALELLRRQGLIADDLDSLPLARAHSVSRDLGTILLDIVSLNDCAPEGQIRELRDVVEDRRLLLRLELVLDEMTRSRATDV